MWIHDFCSLMFCKHVTVVTLQAQSVNSRHVFAVIFPQCTNFPLISSITKCPLISITLYHSYLTLQLTHSHAHYFAHSTANMDSVLGLQYSTFSEFLQLCFCINKNPLSFSCGSNFSMQKNVSSTADNNLFLGRSLFRPHNLGEIFAVGRVTFKSRERNKNKRVTFSFSMITNGGMLKAQYIFIFLNILAG